MRPNIVLYKKPHPTADYIKDMQIADLPTANLLLVVGTLLQIPGAVDMVHQFSAKLHAKNHNNIIYLNKSPPSKNLEHAFDIFFQGDCQQMAEHLLGLIPYPKETPLYSDLEYNI